MRVYDLVLALMNKYPEQFNNKPAAYINRSRLVDRVKILTGKEYSPETITRAQRQVWIERRKEVFI